MRSSFTILSLHFIYCLSGQMDMERASLPIGVTFSAQISNFFNSICFSKSVQNKKKKPNESAGTH